MFQKHLIFFCPQNLQNFVHVSLQQKKVVLLYEKQQFRVLYQVPEAMLYYVEFSVPLSKKGQRQWPGKDKKGIYDWSDGAYIEVGRDVAAQKTAASTP